MNSSKEFFNRGFEKSKSGDYYGAIEDFTKAIDLEPNNAEFYFRRGQAKESTTEISNILQAYSDFLKATQINPRYAEALFSLGSLQMRLSPDDPTGLENLEKAAEIDPTKGSYWNIGIAKMSQQDYEGMYSSFNKFIDSESPDSEFFGDAFYFRALSLLNQSKFEQAIDDFTLAISNKANLNYLWSFFNRAHCYTQTKNIDKAIEDYSRVLQLKPDMVDGLKNRAQLYKIKGMTSDAINDLQNASNIEGQNIEILEELSGLLLATQQYKNALPILTKVIGLDPNKFHHHLNKGTCYFGLGEYLNAIKEYDAAISLNSKVGFAYYYRGYCHFHLENNQACDDWRTAFELGVKEAKPLMDQYCKFEEKRGIDLGNGLFISLDELTPP